MTVDRAKIKERELARMKWHLAFLETIGSIDDFELFRFKRKVHQLEAELALEKTFGNVR